MISVCMATYNGGKYIKEQIGSILHQLGQDDELVISDDGSKDETIAIIEAFNDDRIKLYHNKGRHGFTWNFENALKHAVGDVIFLSDQDDVWKPNKVETCLSEIGEYDMLIHNAEIVDGDGEPKGFDYYCRQHGHSGFWWNLYKTRLLGCCMMFKRQLLEECLPFPNSIVAHDYWIGMYCLSKYKARFIDNQLISYSNTLLN